MSIWCSADVTAYGEEDELAKLLGLNPKDADGLNEVKLSFGRKNGVDLGPLIKNNPELVFLIQTTYECFSGGIHIARYNRATDEIQDVLLESFNYDMIEFNKKIMEDYPDLLREYRKSGAVDWKTFCSDEKRMRQLLNQAEQYEELSALIENQDIEFDNQPLDEE
jgi:hypothetical protein